jgi:hypothetical protein
MLSVILRYRTNTEHIDKLIENSCALFLEKIELDTTYLGLV